MTWPSSREGGGLMRGTLALTLSLLKVADRASLACDGLEVDSTWTPLLYAPRVSRGVKLSRYLAAWYVLGQALKSALTSALLGGGRGYI